jgi:hypothetical protein
VVRVVVWVDAADAEFVAADVRGGAGGGGVGVRRAGQLVGALFQDVGN